MRHLLARHQDERCQAEPSERQRADRAHARTCSSHVEAALEALAQEPGAASAKALGAAVHELGLGCLALKEVHSIKTYATFTKTWTASMFAHLQLCLHGQHLTDGRELTVEQCFRVQNGGLRLVQENGPPVAIAGMQRLLEAASLGATARAGAALAADATALADVEDWDAPPAVLKDGVQHDAPFTFASRALATHTVARLRQSDSSDVYSEIR
jgi:hypothetical protein